MWSQTYTWQFFPFSLAFVQSVCMTGESSISAQTCVPLQFLKQTPGLVCLSSPWKYSVFHPSGQTEIPCSYQWMYSMYTFTCLTVVINIRMVFRYIQYHSDIYHLLYNGFCGLFKSTVFQDFFRWRKKNDWLCGLLFPAAVAFMSWLSAWFPACFFSAVCDLFTLHCFWRGNGRVFIIPVDRLWYRTPN